MPTLSRQTLTVVAIAFLCMAVVCEGRSMAGGISSLHRHVVQDAEVATDWEVIFFSSFPCVSGSPDREVILAENCSGIALTVTGMNDGVEPAIVWARAPVQVSLPFDWGPPNDRIAAAYWDPKTQIVWLAVALTTDQYTFVEVEQLFLQRSSENNQWRVTKAAAQPDRTISHKPKNLGRTLSISFSPAPEGGVRLMTHHERGLTTESDLAIDSKWRDPSSFQFAKVDYIDGLQDALQRHARDRSDAAQFSHLASLHDTTARDEAARDEAPRGEFHLYHFSNLQMQHRVRERDGTEVLVPRHNEGYAILHVTADLPRSTGVTWVRHAPMINSPLREDSPPNRNLAAIWHDQTTHSLWLAVARTTSSQSVVEIERLKLNDAPNGREPVVEKHSLFRRFIPHPHGEADRIVGIQIKAGPEADSIVMTLLLKESPPHEISLGPPRNVSDAVEVRSRLYRQLQDTTPLIRLLGDDAVKRTAAANNQNDPGH